MFALLLLVSLTHALSVRDLTCGNIVIPDPDKESCCNGRPFLFRDENCCNGRVQHAPCPPPDLVNLVGPSLIFRVDASVDEDPFASTELEDSSDESIEATESVEVASEEEEDTESVEEDDDDDDDSDEDLESVESEEEEEEESLEPDVEADLSTGDDDDDGEFGAAFDKDSSLNNNHNNNNNNNNNGASTADMDYYVKITLINMWLILGLILVVNIIFYWCYCRRNQGRLNRVKSNNMFVEDPMQQTDVEEEPHQMV